MAIHVIDEFKVIDIEGDTDTGLQQMGAQVFFHCTMKSVAVEQPGQGIGDRELLLYFFAVVDDKDSE